MSFWKNAIKAHGKPTEKTVGYKGRHYIDLDTGIEYICVEVVNQDDHIPVTSKQNDFVTVETFIPKSKYIWEVFEYEESGGYGTPRDEIVYEMPQKYLDGDFDPETDENVITMGDGEYAIRITDEIPPLRALIETGMLTYKQTDGGGEFSMEGNYDQIEYIPQIGLIMSYMTFMVFLRDFDMGSVEKPAVLDVVGPSALSTIRKGLYLFLAMSASGGAEESAPTTGPIVIDAITKITIPAGVHTVPANAVDDFEAYYLANMALDDARDANRAANTAQTTATRAQNTANTALTAAKQRVEWGILDETNPTSIEGLPFYSTKQFTMHKKLQVSKQTGGYYIAHADEIFDIKSGWPCQLNAHKDGVNYQLLYATAKYGNEYKPFGGDFSINGVYIEFVNATTFGVNYKGIIYYDGFYYSSDDALVRLSQNFDSVAVVSNATVNNIKKLDVKYSPHTPGSGIAISDTGEVSADTAVLATKESVDGKLNSANPVATGSFSMGRKTNSTAGNNSFAVGLSVTAEGAYSHAEGSSTVATGQNAHAEGMLTKASGASHAEGLSTEASNGSHAEGESTKATGRGSHAEGKSTQSTGDYSHAEGVETKATGYQTHAEGKSTEASGESSHAEGYGTKATGTNQHVQGKYNVADTTSAHIVGNGKSVVERSNAHTLDFSGNAWFAGDVYVGSTSGKNKDEGSVKLVKETDISSEDWTFTLESGETVTKKVVLG